MSLTRQEIFDKVAKHLLDQGCKAEMNGLCRYRIEREGRVLRCAAGCLISDDAYSDELRDMDLSGYGSKIVGESRLVRETLKRCGIDEEDFPLVSELQKVHDGYRPERWKRQLASLGERENLAIPDFLKEAA